MAWIAARPERRQAHRVIVIDRQLVHAIADLVEEPNVPRNCRLLELGFASVELRAGNVAAAGAFNTRLLRGLV
jgi:hypothetical protein